MKASAMPPFGAAFLQVEKMNERHKQLDKFKEAARKLECDDDEQRFKERIGKLVKPVPPKKSEP